MLFFNPPFNVLSPDAHWLKACSKAMTTCLHSVEMVVLEGKPILAGMICSMWIYAQDSAVHQVTDIRHPILNT